MKRLIVILMFALSAWPARAAEEWFVVNVKTNTCVPIETVDASIHTPQDFQAYTAQMVMLFEHPDNIAVRYEPSLSNDDTYTFSFKGQGPAGPVDTTSTFYRGLHHCRQALGARLPWSN